jgi:hypothetical protein
LQPGEGKMESGFQALARVSPGQNSWGHLSFNV